MQSASPARRRRRSPRRAAAAAGRKRPRHHARRRSTLPGFTLGELGWSSFFEDHFATSEGQTLGHVPGRVAVQHRGAYVLYTEQGELWAEAAGRLVHDGDLPAVRDWGAATGY